MADSLGILVNSDRHPEYVRELARAARLRGKQVYIHFTGSGLHLARGPLLEELGRIALVSMAESRLSGAGKAVTRLSLPDFFHRCDRTVVF